ncbi:MAG TPA: hypothetical protein PKD55_22720, partial [Bellilinea sp.]|nr:hypothetical protein [Bellilinea sp.]
MKLLLTRFRGVVRRSALRVLLTPFESWVLRTVKSRFQFELEALYWGLQLNRSEGIEYNFRRNIHRLEKGLSHKARRKTFAESYVLETVELLEKDFEHSVFSENTRIWGTSVLSTYFNSSEPTPQTAEARARFYKLITSQSVAEWVPYPIHKRPPLSVTYDQFMQLCLRRRSVRFFENRAVESGLIEKAMCA